MRRALERWLVVGVVGLSAPATADDTAGAETVGTYASQHPLGRYAVGYQRGMGLDNYGASLAFQPSPRVTPQLLVFALHSPGSTGVAVAPAIQLSVLDGYRNTPYVMGGFTLVQRWIGDGSGHATGGFLDGGFAFRPGLGLSIELGLGFNWMQHITATDGVVSMKQAPTFSMHLDGGVRYWF